MDEKSDQQVFEELHAENDPVLRAEVSAELKKRGIRRIDLFGLELSLKFGARDFYKRTPWFEKKHRLHVHMRQYLRDMAESPPEDWPYLAKRIIDKITPVHYEYDLRLSEDGLKMQPHPNTFLQALQEGADPKVIALTICNTWMSKRAFIKCANELGNDVLMWDDERSLSWLEWKKSRPENQHLCEEMSVHPAGLVAIEPFTMDNVDGFEYDLYGTTIAEVTSFLVSFKPKEGVESKLLARQVDNALRDFIKKGRQTFYEPISRFTNPENAYDRPRRLMDEKSWVTGVAASQIVFDLKRKYPDVVYDYEGQNLGKNLSEEERKKYMPHLDEMREAIECFLEDKETKTTPFPAEILDYLKTYKDEMEMHHFTYVADNGDVVVKKTLILDDVLELYKFCDTFLTPCVSVAQTLNNAKNAAP